MTINIGLVTSDALVLGCDSIASVSEPLLNPFSVGALDLDESGKAIVDADGRVSVKFRMNHLTQLTTNAWGGVTKMIQIHDKPTPVVAVTAGLAKLCNRPIASWGHEFFRLKRDQDLTTVNDVATEFLAFMRQKYTDHYQDSTLPEQFRNGPSFLVGGFGEYEEFPSLYRLDIQANSITPHFTQGACGLAWAGQSDAVERWARGYDTAWQVEVFGAMSQAIERAKEEFTKGVGDYIAAIKKANKRAKVPDYNLQIDEKKLFEIDWQKFNVSIDYSNLPEQQAVDLVSFLVLVQTAKARFTTGVATVGGRTHVGVITKQQGFRLLNEQTVQHRYTGFGDDA